MATLRENIFKIKPVINKGPQDHSQEKAAIRGISSLLGSMALGRDPGDDALFRQRLELAKKYQAETEGVGLENAILLMRTDAAMQAGHEGYDNMKATNPAQSLNLALALSENQKRPGYLEKQSMLNQARKMFLPESAEDASVRELAMLESGAGDRIGEPRYSEDDLMRAFNLFSGKTTGAGDSFTMADKQA